MFTYPTNFDAVFDCYTDPQCINKVKCKAPLIPICRNHKCVCDPHSGTKTTWSERSNDSGCWGWIKKLYGSIVR
ncbi:hypothetical protein P8452_48068 [Trifolium repens]|nr:hypothetical protein P8452_48068 [Trifolium repens]